MDEAKEESRPVVLLIEDETLILTIHQTFLTRMGVLVDTAVTGEEAYKKFQDNSYSLVILDGGLPDTNGKELGIRIRAYEKNISRPRTPLILLSGYTDEMVKDWCDRADIDSYAIKPVHPSALEQLVRRFIKTSF
jgi:DNA-binding response OmpR family regulator